MNENANVNQNEGQERRCRHGLRRPHGFLGGLFLGGLLGAVIVGGLAWTGARAMASGGLIGSHFHASRGGCSKASCKEHAQFAAEWGLRKVDATDEQQASVKKIVAEAVDDLSALAEKHHGNREAMALELGKAQVDREAIERIRKAEMELAEQASSRLMAAIADAADTLTQDQRKELIELAHEMHQ